MTTIINATPKQGSDEGLGLGLIVGMLLVALFAFLFYIYGLPMLRATEDTQPTVQKIEIQVPAETPAVSP